jgi:hypothetical protein
LLKVGAARWGLLFVAVAVACACGALAPAAYATLGVPTGGPPTTLTGSGASTAGAMASFEAAAGGTDNGTAAGEQGSGYRHATWDQIALDGSDPGSTTIMPGQVIVPARSRLQPWGLELGPDIAVSDNGFQSVSSTQFSPFSAPNIWGPFNSDTAEFDVVAPAAQGTTPEPAQTRGLGVVFLNSTASTQIQYYNGDILLGSVTAPTSTTTSFAGLLFPDAVVTRVVVILGGSEIFGWNGATVTPGVSTSVAGDDIVLTEPGPKVNATAGVPISPVLDTVTESNANAYVSATIDWGDGTRSTGTLVPAAGGALAVTGTHAYTETGIYKAVVTADDSDGTQQASDTLIQVVPRASTTSVSCSPSPVAVTASTMCTATVADAGAGGPITPTGTVELSSPTAGASFADDSGCVLGATGTPGVAICEARFTPTQLPPAQARIDAFYAGDGAHVGSSDSAIIGVRAQRCTLKALSARLKGHPAVLGMVVTCDARANVTIAIKATGARKGRFKAFTLQFGSLRATVTAGRPTVLVIRPSQAVVNVLRTAGRRHQRVSLKLTLTASSHATRTTTTTRVAALRIR